METQMSSFGTNISFKLRHGTNCSPLQVKKFHCRCLRTEGGRETRGSFLPPHDPATPVVWLASGVGVTPFLAMAAAEPGRDAVLVWRLREGDDPSWAAEALGHLRVLLVGPEGIAVPKGWHRLGERLDADALAAVVPDLASRTGYAAGSPTWVAAMRRVARAAGLRRLRTDRFLGY